MASAAHGLTPILSGMAVDYFSVDGVKDWHTILADVLGGMLFSSQ